MYEDRIYFCTACNRKFDIGPIMLKLADTAKTQADWDAPLHCPHCDSTKIKKFDDKLIHRPPTGAN